MSTLMGMLVGVAHGHAAHLNRGLSNGKASSATSLVQLPIHGEN